MTGWDGQKNITFYEEFLKVSELSDLQLQKNSQGIRIEIVWPFRGTHWGNKPRLFFVIFVEKGNFSDPLSYPGIPGVSIHNLSFESILTIFDKYVQIFSAQNRLAIFNNLPFLGLKKKGKIANFVGRL